MNNSQNSIYLSDRRYVKRMRWLDGITNARNMNLGKLQGMVKDREACHAAVPEVKESQTLLGDWITTKVSLYFFCFFFESSYHDKLLILSNASPVAIEMIMWFFYRSCYITLIDFHMLNCQGLSHTLSYLWSF